VAEILLKNWIDDEPYFHLSPPKTTGRELFGEQYGAALWDQGKKSNLSDADYASTITAFTVVSIADAYRDFMPSMPEEIVVSGGGAYNRTLLKMLAAKTAPARVRTIDDLGMPPDAKEAVAFAVLAYETWHNRPDNLPSATGARKPVVLGSITPGDNFARISL
jgi:anhydro-N-acetylmuramic acid kinase